MSALTVEVSIAALAASSATPSANCSEYVVGYEALGCCYHPSPFLAQHLEQHGLGAFKAVPEVLDEYAASVEKLAQIRPILRNTLLAHSASVIAEVEHLNSRCPRFTNSHQQMLADPVIQRVLDARPSWKLQALVVAAAVEFNLPILGFGAFYRAFDEQHPIRSGVRDPRDGAWVIPPSV